MTHPGTITEAESAQAWLDHRGLDLDQIAQLPFGQLVLVLDVFHHKTGGACAIPQHVTRTLAAHERQKDA